MSKSGGLDRTTLDDGTDEALSFRIAADRQLRMLDRAGQTIESALIHDLNRLPQLDPIAGPFALRGHYVYLADAAALTECRTGKRYPVSIEA